MGQEVDELITGAAGSPPEFTQSERKLGGPLPADASFFIRRKQAGCLRSTQEFFFFCLSHSCPISLNNGQRRAGNEVKKPTYFTKLCSADSGGLSKCLRAPLGAEFSQPPNRVYLNPPPLLLPAAIFSCAWCFSELINRVTQVSIKGCRRGAAGHYTAQRHSLNPFAFAGRFLFFFLSSPRALFIPPDVGKA